MSRSLEDPRLVRRLAAACRRARARPRRWWSLQRGNGGGEGRVTTVVYRLGIMLLIAGAGSLVVDRPLTAHLLALLGMLLTVIRVQQTRQRLMQDPALAVFAQLPVAAWQVFDRQMRKVDRAAIWAGIDAAAFWAVAWLRMDVPAGIWWWLPVIAATQALLVHGVALALVRVWPNPGCWLPLLLVVLACGTVQKRMPVLDVLLDPLLQAIAWLTPWGWLSLLSVRLPHEGHILGVGLLGLLLAAIAATSLAHGWLRRNWRLAPAWREVAGRPHQTWHEDDDAGSAPSVENPTTVLQPLTVERTSVEIVWKRLCVEPAGRSLAKLGRVGDVVGRRLDADGRCLADLLAPVAVGRSARRWALVVAALPVLSVLIGVSPLWGVAGLAAVLVWRKHRWAMLPAIILLLCRWRWPEPTDDLTIVLSCFIAVLLAIPIAGGTWAGLPMGCTVLGNMPRRWSVMMRIMVTVTTLRLLSGLPVLVLSGFALGWGFHPAVAAVVGGIWLALLLATPWLSAYLLIKRTPGGLLDLGLGRRVPTALGALCVIAQVVGSALLVAGACLACTRDGGGLQLLAIAGSVIVATSAIQLPLLRHAYRRRVDLIPPV